MPSIVVSTATLRCKHGSAPAPLVCSGIAQVEIVFKPAATVDDYRPGQNIFPFGICSITGGSCVPVTSSPWTPGSSVFIGGLAALRADATLSCGVAGVERVIRVVDAGQHSVNIHALETQFMHNIPTDWTTENRRQVEIYIQYAIELVGGDVESAFAVLRDLRQRPENYYDSNLAIAADYLRARWDTRRWGPDVERLHVRGYMFLKRHGRAPKGGPGPVSPPSTLQEEYMRRGIRDQNSHEPRWKLPLNLGEAIIDDTRGDGGEER